MHSIQLYLIVLVLIHACANVCAQKEMKEAFISPNGKDTNPGTKEKPWATVQKAINEANLHPGMEKIWIRKGIYYINKGMRLEREKAAVIRPLLISNYLNEAVTFHGGKRLDNKKFERVKDASILNRFPQIAKAKVYQLSLPGLGISNFGRREQHGFGSPSNPAPLEVFFNNVPLIVARYPNTGRLKIGDVLFSSKGKTPEDPIGKGHVFKYADDRADRWAKADNAWIGGYFSYGYCDDNLKIAAIDREEKTIKTVQSHIYKMYSNADTSDIPVAHAKNFRGYYVYNLLEEIDTPGEWFLDEKTGMLYLWPTSEISRAVIDVSLLEDPFITFQNEANINVKGIKFEASRGMGLFIGSSNKITIEDCTFRNLGTVAISMGRKFQNEVLAFNADGSPTVVKSPAKNSQDIIIKNVRVFDTGCGGIIANGGDRKTLTPGGILIENCTLQRFSRINKTYSPGISLSGVGNIIRHCYLSDTPHEAIDFWGNNHIIEYNHLERICTDASDMGAIYTGRNPSARGTIIRNNYFANLTPSINNSICAIYIDDGSGGIKVEGNVFYKAGNKGSYNFGTVFVHGGHDNHFTNNVFIDCPLPFAHADWKDQRWKDFIKSPLIQQRTRQEVNIQSPEYLKQYPDLINFFDTTRNEPRYNYAENNVAYRCNGYAKGKFILSKNSLITDTDPGFLDAANLQFGFKKDAAVFRLLPGFKNISFDAIRKAPE